MTSGKRKKSEKGVQLSAAGTKPKPRGVKGAVLRDVNSSRKSEPDRGRASEKQDGAKLSAVDNDPSDENGAVLRKVNDEREGASQKDAKKPE